MILCCNQTFGRLYVVSGFGIIWCHLSFFFYLFFTFLHVQIGLKSMCSNDYCHVCGILLSTKKQFCLVWMGGTLCLFNHGKDLHLILIPIVSSDYIIWLTILTPGMTVIVFLWHPPYKPMLSRALRWLDHFYFFIRKLSLYLLLSDFIKKSA